MSRRPTQAVAPNGGWALSHSDMFSEKLIRSRVLKSLKFSYQMGLVRLYARFGVRYREFKNIPRAELTPTCLVQRTSFSGCPQHCNL